MADNRKEQEYKREAADLAALNEDILRREFDAIIAEMERDEK